MSLQMTSLRRLYANTYTDADKQDAINLLLGNFVPRAGTGHLWDLQSDIYLHAAGIAQRCRPCLYSALHMSSQEAFKALVGYFCSTLMSSVCDEIPCMHRRDPSRTHPRCILPLWGMEHCGPM